MNIIGCLDTPSGGEYILDGLNTKCSDSKLAEIRNKKIGFIFQNYNLLPKLNVLENVELPLLYLGMSFIFQQFHLIESLTIGQNVELPLLYKGNIPHKERDKSIEKYLDMVGLLNKKNQIPTELSGGQQQRIAIARALINNPYVIFADEPTGALDSKTGREVLNMLEDLNKEGNTIIIITHDKEIAAEAKRMITVRDGIITSDTWKVGEISI